MEQIIRYQREDGVFVWRDIYSGPHGTGYTDYEEQTVDGVTEIRSKHTGPEQREDTNWEWVKVEKADV